MSSVTVSAKVLRQKQVRFAASLHSDMRAPVFSPSISVDQYGIAKGKIDGLLPATRYYVGVAGPGGLVSDRFIGSARTPPVAVPEYQFSFVAASCADTGAEGVIFRNIAQKAAMGLSDFGMHLGDFHYLDPGDHPAGLGQYHYTFDEVFESETQHEMFRSMPWYYMRDDHEVSGDSNVTSPGTAHFISLYRNRVPSPTLGSAVETDPPYFSFVRGRIRFVTTDLRSDRDPDTMTDGPGKRMMQATQDAWFKSEITAAKAAGQAVVWFNTLPWVSPVGEADNWGSYSYHRQEIADFIVSEGMTQRIAIISGDMHALAFDDGTNSPAGIPVCQCAPFYRSNSIKGGPYTHGPFTTSESQYGHFQATRVSTTVWRLRFRGLSVDQMSGSETAVIDQTISFTLPVVGGM